MLLTLLGNIGHFKPLSLYDLFNAAFIFFIEKMKNVLN